MSQQFPTQFHNANFVLPSANQRGIRRPHSEQCIVLIAKPQIQSSDTEFSDVCFELDVDVATLIKGNDSTFEWVNSRFDEVFNVRGWVPLPDLDTLSREPLESPENVIAIYTGFGDILNACQTNKIDVTEESFVGWFPIPDVQSVMKSSTIGSGVEDESKYLCLVHFDDASESSSWDVAFIGSNQLQFVQGMQAEVLVVPAWSDVLTSNITHVCKLGSKAQESSLISLLESQDIKIVDCTQFPTQNVATDSGATDVLKRFEKDFLARI